ncbi:MAG: PD-(D/E)XK nuclease family protein, partial [Limisphaerales bacterium]
MRISFLLGAAGSGKTYRCLNEIRDELLSRPKGPPLIFLAPKQSTYQLERQLLEGGLAGFSRLQIVSFERFAHFIFQEIGETVPKFISEEGRTMVLRALLTEMQGDLAIFRGAARRLGFAEELSKQIRELQNHGLSAADVRRMAAQVTAGHSARDKLLDLALVQERYAEWLTKQGLEDGDALLTAAKESLEKSAPGRLELGGIWFDGFAQLTPQELELLVVALRNTPRATLAFCVDAETRIDSKLSANYLVSQTVARCRSAIELKYGKESVTIEGLRRDANRSRFAECAGLRHLEKSWHTADKFEGPIDNAVRVVEGTDPEAEAIFVAREIVQHVRSGGRYREVALLLRELQNDYPHLLRRVFGRYQIPFFLDHRESVAHHPMAELTRGALRTVAYN